MKKAEPMCVPGSALTVPASVSGILTSRAHENHCVICKEFIQTEIGSPRPPSLPHHTHTHAYTAESPLAVQSHTVLRRNPIHFIDERPGYIQAGPFFLHLVKCSGTQSFSLVISVVKNICSPFPFSLSEAHNTVGKTSKRICKKILRRKCINILEHIIQYFSEILNRSLLWFFFSPPNKVPVNELG